MAAKTGASGLAEGMSLSGIGNSSVFAAGNDFSGFLGESCFVTFFGVSCESSVSCFFSSSCGETFEDVLADFLTPSSRIGAGLFLGDFSFGVSSAGGLTSDAGVLFFPFFGDFVFDSVSGIEISSLFVVVVVVVVVVFLLFSSALVSVWGVFGTLEVFGSSFCGVSAVSPFFPNDECGY